MHILKLTSFLVMVLATLASLSSGVAQTVVVGGKNFTEQLVIAEITSQLLQARGYPAMTKTGFSTIGVRKEQEAGRIDVYWEYTGTSLLIFNGVEEKLAPDEAYARVADLDAEKGLIWLSPSRVNNTYALAMRRVDAEVRGIRSISDLAERARRGETFELACNNEFYMRPDGLRPMERAYRFEFAPKKTVRVETDAVYELLNSGNVDVGLVFSTDGRVPALNLSLLNDDLGFFPAYLLTPVVREEVLKQLPDIAALLNALSARLDNATISGLNASVDVQKRPVEEVAASFLRAQGLM
jgi:osmoprotectant transport system substrate-binding protein